MGTFCTLRTSLQLQLKNCPFASTLTFNLLAVSPAGKMLMTDLLKAEEIKKALDAFAGWLTQANIQRSVLNTLTITTHTIISLPRPHSHTCSLTSLTPDTSQTSSSTDWRQWLTLHLSFL